MPDANVLSCLRAKCLFLIILDPGLTYSACMVHSSALVSQLCIQSGAFDQITSGISHSSQEALSGHE